MSYTRFHDDPARIKKQMETMTFTSTYQLDVPGPGDKMPLYNDPHIRLQKWGANIRTNDIDLESDFLGLTRKTNRDNIELNEYRHHSVLTEPKKYQEADPTTEESRASHPAFMYRTVEWNRWEQPWINPQANIEIPFHNNIQTRIIEKDAFTPTIPVVSRGLQAPIDTEFYLTGRTMCVGGTCDIQR
jgi:hypothetical protein